MLQMRQRPGVRAGEATWLVDILRHACLTVAVLFGVAMLLLANAHHVLLLGLVSTGAGAITPLILVHSRPGQTARRRRDPPV